MDESASVSVSEAAARSTRTLDPLSHGRTAIAFAASVAVLPLTFAITNQLFAGEPNFVPPVLIAAITVCALLTALVGGLPLHLMLISRGMARWWAYAAVGAALGFAWPAMFGLLGRTPASTWFATPFTLLCALSGGISATVFYLSNDSDRGGRGV